MLLAWTRRSLLAGLGAAVLSRLLRPVSAEEKLIPKGPVILTIAGDIAHTNRDEFNPKLDGFMKYHEIEFKRAFAFDMELLEDFPYSEITCQPPQYPSNVKFEGPLLRDVLKAFGAQGASIKTRALDGFAVDLSPEQIAAKDWILATHADGKPFGVGDKGPVWLMHTPSAEKVPDEEEQGWPWAVFYIEVKK